MYNGRQKVMSDMCVWCTKLGGAVVRLTVSRQNGIYFNENGYGPTLPLRMNVLSAMNMVFFLEGILVGQIKRSCNDKLSKHE